jgi:cation transport ATPase
MTCAACATRIEKGLNKLDGVVKANVNLALEKATVEYKSKVLSSGDIGKTAMLAAIDGQFAGMVAVADTIKKTSKTAISRLKNMNTFAKS